MKNKPKKTSVNAMKPAVSAKGNGPAAKFKKVKTGSTKMSRGC